MKVFSFDCWGKGMELVERVQRRASPNCVMVSGSTINLVKNLGAFNFTDSQVSVEVNNSSS